MYFHCLVLPSRITATRFSYREVKKNCRSTREETKSHHQELCDCLSKPNAAVGIAAVLASGAETLLQGNVTGVNRTILNSKNIANEKWKGTLK